MFSKKTYSFINNLWIRIVLKANSMTVRIIGKKNYKKHIFIYTFVRQIKNRIMVKDLFERIQQNKGPLGEILIRCNNILYISGVEELGEDDNGME